VELQLDLPDGATTLRIEALGASGGDKLVLLSPRLELTPRWAAWNEHPLSWRDAESLLDRVPVLLVELRPLPRPGGSAAGISLVGRLAR